MTQISSYLDPGGKILISADRHATVLPVVVAAPEEDRIADLISLVERSDGSGGFAAHITGSNTLDRDFTELSASDLSKGELQFGLPAALIVLLLVVGTLVGVAIPMLMAIISIIVALGITAVVGQAFELNLFILNMIVAMGLALGIDYSLFIVSRLREERHRGAGTREAILTVANTATRAVVFSGTAFALAMIAMLLVPDTTLRSLGLGAVIVGLVSIVVALTFHPAILMVLGDRVERLRVPWLGRRVAASAGEEGPLWRRAVLAVMRRPAISLVATTVVLLALAFPVLGLQLGAAGTSSLPDSSVAKQGLLALERDFPSGATEPVTIVFDGSPDDPVARQGLARLRAELAGDRDFAARALTVETGPRIGVASVPLTVEPSSARGSAAIDRLRDEYVPAAFGAAADRVFVGGTPAEAHDSFAVNRSWLPIVIALRADAELRPAHARVPVDRDTPDRDRRQPALRRRRLRDPRARLPARRRQRSARVHAGRADRRLGADLPVQRAVRALDGLPGVPAQPHPRALGGDRRHLRRDRPRRGLHRPADHRRRGDHHRRLRRLRLGPARRLPGDGLRHRDRARARRHDRAPAAHPRRHAPARRAQLVPARLASWLPDVQVEGPRPAPLQPAVLVRQYTGDGVLTETSPAPPDPPSRPPRKADMTTRHHARPQLPPRRDSTRPGTRERRRFPGWRWMAVGPPSRSPGTSAGGSADA